MLNKISSKDNDQPNEFFDASTFRLRNQYKVSAGLSEGSQRYIISADINDIYSALGCMLLVLLPCWKYAKATKRILVIDWRGNSYARRIPNKNLFPLLFQIPNKNDLGVSCIADDTINYLALPQPIFAPAGRFINENGEQDMLTIKTYNRDQIKIVLEKQKEIKNPTIIPSVNAAFVLANNHGPISFFGNKVNQNVIYSMDDAKQLYRAIKPLPKWKRIADDFAADQFSDRPILGVHIRHGNGEGDFRDHFKKRSIDNMDKFIDVMVRKIKHYGQQHFNDDYTLLLCTDSVLVIDAVKPHFSHFSTRLIWRPEPGAGLDFDVMYKDVRGLQSAINALIDMLLLAKCDTVLMTRDSAFLAQVPYVFEKPNAIFLNANQTSALPYS
jgi:hypothetical protein